jgi:hypothetical protein
MCLVLRKDDRLNAAKPRGGEANDMHLKGQIKTGFTGRS